MNGKKKAACGAASIRLGHISWLALALLCCKRELQTGLCPASITAPGRKGEADPPQRQQEAAVNGIPGKRARLNKEIQKSRLNSFKHSISIYVLSKTSSIPAPEQVLKKEELLEWATMLGQACLLPPFSFYLSFSQHVAP